MFTISPLSALREGLESELVIEENQQTRKPKPALLAPNLPSCRAGYWHLPLPLCGEFSISLQLALFIVKFMLEKAKMPLSPTSTAALADL